MRQLNNDKTLTVCLPYYRNPGMLRLQYERFKALPKHLKRKVSLIVVDDGSPDGDAEGADLGLPLTIYKIGVDIRWNQDAARNIAAHHAESRWLLLTDIDHLIPEQTLQFCCNAALHAKHVYKFSRETLEPFGAEPPTTPCKPHPNSWLMTRKMYEKIGGYDERFAGYYGTDGVFRDSVVKVCTEIVTLKAPLIRVSRTIVADASTTTYQRKQPEDMVIKTIRLRRDLDPNWRPKRLSFPYRKIFP